MVFLCAPKPDLYSIVERPREGYIYSSPAAVDTAFGRKNSQVFLVKIARKTT